ncbi:Heat shock factor protein [Yarrowia sp. C11]|nr:Heat shock factor protein [Yarrowia sp. C11]
MSNTLVKKGQGQAASNAKKIGYNKKKGGGQTKGRPAFVFKLWNMVNDPAYDEYIRWMHDGKSFQITGREQLEKIVLPRFFKHNNFSSFVRQLNMYGWHKVQDVTSGSMQSNDEVWQFKSPNFIRGREDLLDNIVRNKGTKGSDEEEEMDMTTLMDELQQIKLNQLNLTQEVNKLRTDNQLLWQENLGFKDKHKQHGETLERIMRFLASLYGNQGKVLGEAISGNRNQRLLLGNTDPAQATHMINEAAAAAAAENNGNFPFEMNDVFNNGNKAGDSPSFARVQPLSSTNSPQTVAGSPREENNTNNYDKITAYDTDTGSEMHDNLQDLTDLSDFTPSMLDPQAVQRSMDPPMGFGDQNSSLILSNNNQNNNMPHTPMRNSSTSSHGSQNMSHHNYNYQPSTPGALFPELEAFQGANDQLIRSAERPRNNLNINGNGKADDLQRQLQDHGRHIDQFTDRLKKQQGYQPQQMQQPQQPMQVPAPTPATTISSAPTPDATADLFGGDPNIVSMPDFNMDDYIDNEADMFDPEVKIEEEMPMVTELDSPAPRPKKRKAGE